MVDQRTERLSLLGQDADDVATISALVQDAAVRRADVGYDRKLRTLALIMNRYRWEAPKVPTRVRSALRIGGVLNLSRREWPADPEAILALLAVTSEPDGEDVILTLHFSGGPALRVLTECIDLALDDLTGPWGARAEPKHQ